MKVPTVLELIYNVSIIEAPGLMEVPTVCKLISIIEAPSHEMSMQWCVGYYSIVPKSPPTHYWLVHTVYTLALWSMLMDFVIRNDPSTSLQSNPLLLLLLLLKL